MEDKEVKIEEVSLDDAAPMESAESAAGAENAHAENAAAARGAKCNATNPADGAKCENQIDTLVAEIRELNDKYLRMAAELENTRRRAAIDAENRARTRAMSIAGKILPVMDAVDAALKHNPDDAGIQALARAMESVFAQIGVVRIESVGQKLNPQYHNAIQVMARPADADPMPDADTIATEMQPGYMFGDNVLRTAMVVVYK